MEEADLETLALGYLRAYQRLHRALYDALINGADSRVLFIPVHEALGWLYTILEREDVEPFVDPQMASALRFIRSRVHHRWADAVELRNDVRIKPVWLGWQAGRHVHFIDPTVYTDWCWRGLADLPRGDSPRASAYVAELEGRPVHYLLHTFADLLYALTHLTTAEVDLGTPIAS